MLCLVGELSFLLPFDFFLLEGSLLFLRFEFTECF